MISDITDRLLPQIEDWQKRPLGEVYLIVFIVYCKKMSGCFSSRSTISFFITVVEFTEIFSQGR